MNDPIKEVQHAEMTVRVFQDPNPIHPREDCENMSEIVHWHRRYDFGKKLDRHASCSEIISQQKECGDPILVILPLFLHDHSGITISVVKFPQAQNDPMSIHNFDSGQVGWIYITQSKSDSMGCVSWSDDEYETAIRSEVETYDYYLRGATYGYEVEDVDFGTSTIEVNFLPYCTQNLLVCSSKKI